MAELTLASFRLLRYPFLDADEEMPEAGGALRGEAEDEDAEFEIFEAESDNAEEEEAVYDDDDADDDEDEGNDMMEYSEEEDEDEEEDDEEE